MIAYSCLDLKPWEFWDNMSPRDFLKMCEGFNLRYRREFSLKLEEMKLMRWVGSLIYNVNVKTNHRKDPDKLYPLPKINGIEKENKKLNIPTKEQMEEMGALPPPRKLDDTGIMEVVEEYKKKTK